MRIDILFNKLCLTKTRSIAKHACDKKLVCVNGKTVKASAEIKAGDIISFDLYGYHHEIRMDEVPCGNVAKKDAAGYYTVLLKSPLE